MQAVGRNLSRFDPREFDYLIVDEAHHAVADSYRSVLGYFQPRFLLGLTATPDRTDERSLLDVFRQNAHRLDLDEAVRGEFSCRSGVFASKRMWT